MFTIEKMSREELIQKLKAAQDKNGVFTVDEDPIESNSSDYLDDNLSKEERVNRAISSFEESLDNPGEKVKVYILS